MLGAVSSLIGNFTSLMRSLGSLSDLYSRESAPEIVHLKKNFAFADCFVRSSILPFGTSHFQLKIRNNRLMPLIRGV